MTSTVKSFFLFLSKILLKFAIDKGLQFALPRIYEELDSKIPTMLFNGASPPVVQKEIELAIKKATGKPVTSDVIDIVTRLYDPVQNARAVRRHRR